MTSIDYFICILKTYQILFAGLLTFMGVIIGFIINAYNDKSRRFIEAKNLASAFKGELFAISEIVRKRGYIKFIENLISNIEISHEANFPKINITKEYFYVFKNNIHKIGTLKSPLPEKISAYYVQANSILEDLLLYYEGGRDHVGWQFAISYNKETLGLFVDNEALAKDIIKTIDKLYPEQSRLMRLLKYRIF